MEFEVSTLLRSQISSGMYTMRPKMWVKLLFKTRDMTVKSECRYVTFNESNSKSITSENQKDSFRTRGILRSHDRMVISSYPTEKQAWTQRHRIFGTGSGDSATRSFLPRPTLSDSDRRSVSEADKKVVAARCARVFNRRPGSKPPEKSGHFQQCFVRAVEILGIGNFNPQVLAQPRDA